MATTEAGQLAPIDRALHEVRGLLGAKMKTIAAVLGQYMPPERFCGAVLTLCQQNPDLLDPRKVERGSLLLAVLRIAQLQLSPDPALGQAWIVPRKGRAEFQLGYKGCIALAYRSPLVGVVRYGVVGNADHFIWRDGREWVLEHEPTEEGWPDRMEDIRGAWVIIETRSGHKLPRVMYRAEILRHKARGQGAQPAWATDPAPMCLKTVLGDACRRGPFEGEIGRAFALDHSGEIGRGQPADIDAEYVVNGATNGKPTDGPKTAADRFKEKHLDAQPALSGQPVTIDVPAEPELAPAEGEPPSAQVIDLMAALKASIAQHQSPGDREPGEDDEAEPEHLPMMRPEQVKRIREQAVAKGLDEIALIQLLGGCPPEAMPAAQETVALAAIRDYRAPKPPGMETR